LVACGDKGVPKVISEGRAEGVPYEVMSGVCNVGLEESAGGQAARRRAERSK
jgi:hypothetical protein